jgi:hypothetical protein
MNRLIKKINLNCWKKKAVNRALEIRRLNKKILELEESRDNWKGKTAALQINNKMLEEELKKNS